MLHTEAHNHCEVFSSISNIPVTSEGIGGGLYQIGKPCTLPATVDPNGRISNFLKTKMTVIDMIPCSFNINVGAVSGKNLSGMIPRVVYEDDRFKQDYNSYGIKGNFVGIRLYTSDETQARDSITNSRNGRNLFQDLANKVYDTLQPIYRVASSTGLSSNQGVSELIGRTTQKVGGGVAGMAGMVGAGDELKGQLEAATTGVLDKLASSAIDGFRYSFPKIWSDSSYTPNLAVTIKLISPYGHPDAVRRFIIEPLMMLFILGGAKTEDGISYGRPYAISLDAYGMTHSPLASMQSINLARGGSHTTFNLYRQPLSIDVSIQFEVLMSGFASYVGEKNEKEKNIAEMSNSFITDFGLGGSGYPTITTLGHIVQSLRPIPPDGEIHAHVYLGNPNNSDTTSKYLNEAINGNVERTEEKTAHFSVENMKSTNVTDDGMSHTGGGNPYIPVTEETGSIFNKSSSNNEMSRSTGIPHLDDIKKRTTGEIKSYIGSNLLECSPENLEDDPSLDYNTSNKNITNQDHEENFNKLTDYNTQYNIEDDLENTKAYEHFRETELVIDDAINYVIGI